METGDLFLDDVGDLALYINHKEFPEGVTVFGKSFVPSFKSDGMLITLARHQGRGDPAHLIYGFLEKANFKELNINVFDLVAKVAIEEKVC